MLPYIAYMDLMGMYSYILACVQVVTWENYGKLDKTDCPRIVHPGCPKTVSLYFIEVEEPYIICFGVSPPTDQDSN
jgi:hypothetical protein